MKIGIAFAGGAGRGAYEIGVWKAMHETGFDQAVSAVSGSSVGGLNAALFLQGDFEKAVKTWENISDKKILSLGNESLQEWLQRGFHVFDRAGLTQIIEESLDLDVFDHPPGSVKNCYITCFRVSKEEKGRYLAHLEDPVRSPVPALSEKGAEYFNMKDFSDSDRVRLLLATSAIPFVYPKEKIQGHYYIDGGTWSRKSSDNLPVLPLYEKEKCDFIIALALEEDYYNTDFKTKYPGAEILVIRPQENPGRFMNFSPELAKKRIEQGYQDTIGIFRRIKGLAENIKEGFLSAQDMRKKRELQQESARNQMIVENILEQMEKEYLGIGHN